MAEMGAPISLDGVAVQPDCWCVCLCYLHFAPENPEDGEMYLRVPFHPGYPGHVKWLCVLCDGRKKEMLSHVSLSHAAALQHESLTVIPKPGPNS